MASMEEAIRKESVDGRFLRPASGVFFIYKSSKNFVEDFSKSNLWKLFQNIPWREPWTNLWKIFQKRSLLWFLKECLQDFLKICLGKFVEMTRETSEWNSVIIFEEVHWEISEEIQWMISEAIHARFFNRINYHIQKQLL